MVALAAGGRQLDDALAAELAAEPELALLCGRYEGFDERVHEHLATDVVSIGPYVLAGGELAAMVVCDAVIRKLPGRARPRGQRASRSRSARAWRARRSTRTTRGRPSGAATGCRRCCSPATTREIREWRLEQSRARAQQRARPAEPGPGRSLSLRYHCRPRADRSWPRAILLP